MATVQSHPGHSVYHVMSWTQVSFYWTLAARLPALVCLVPLIPVPVGIRLKLNSETGALDLSRDVRMFTTRREKIFSKLELKRHLATGKVMYVGT